MNVEPTYTDKVRRLPWAIVNQSLNAASAQLSFAGPLIVLALSSASLSKFQTSVLLALFPITSLLAVFIAPYVARFGYKRTYFVFYALRTVALGLFVAGVWFAGAIAGNGILIITVSIAAFAVLRTVVETGYNTWFQEFVPNSTRSRYNAIANLLSNTLSAIGLFVVAFLIGDSINLSSFSVPFAISLAAALGAYICAMFIPGGAPRPDARASSQLSGLLDALQSRTFAIYLIGLGLITLGSSALTFVPLLLKERNGLSYEIILFLSALTLIAAMLSVNLWNWAANRWGNKPVTLLSLLTVAAMPILWLMAPVSGSIATIVAIPISIFAGLASSGWAVGSVVLLLSTAMPSETRSNLLTINYAWMGLTSGAGLLIAGAVLDLVQPVPAGTTVSQPDQYVFLFILSFVCCGAGLLFLRNVGETRATRLRDLLTMLLTGNPFRAAGSLIKYRRARAESERVSVTERMGNARSLLNLDELLDAMMDPSFNVRNEAIIAISRMPPDQRILNALVEALHGNTPELSMSAAWALGRMGDRQAIAPLREALSSKHGVLKAMAARSLATLGDADAIPLLLDSFDAETDDGLRTAYASALGTLRSRDAVKPLLAFLYQSRGNDTRMELALSLARISEYSDHFVQLAKHVRTEPAAALSQAALELKRVKSFQSLPEMAEIIDQCGSAFARDDTTSGIQYLTDLARLVPRAGQSNVHAWILQECAERLSEFSSARPEYTLLALHTLATAFL